MLTHTSSARDLAARAQEMGASILRGKLTGHTSEGWAMDGKPVMEWLTRFEGQQIFLIAVAINATTQTTVVKRTCHTCGRDYEGHECPYCREARLRLRGR